MTDRFAPYEGGDDAEKILEKTMKRRRWSSQARDDLAAALETIVARERERK